MSQLDLGSQSYLEDKKLKMKGGASALIMEKASRMQHNSYLNEDNQRLRADLQRKIDMVAAQLAPMADRIGRALVDYSSHLASYGAESHNGNPPPDQTLLSDTFAQPA